MKIHHSLSSVDMNVYLLRRERAQSLELAIHFLRTAARHQGQVLYYLRPPFAWLELRKYLRFSAIAFARLGRLGMVGLWIRLFSYFRLDAKPVPPSTGDSAGPGGKRG